MITKPLRVSRLNWANPLTRGLTFFAPLNEMAGAPRDLVTGTPAGGTVPTWTGRGMTCKQILPPLWITTAANVGLGDFTAMYCGGMVNSNNSDNYSFGNCDGGTLPSYWLNLGQQSYAIFGVYGGGWRGVPQTYPTDTSVNNVWIGVRKNAGTEFYLYLNGALIVSNLAATAMSLAANSRLGFAGYGSNTGTTYQSASEHVAAGFWNRALSPAEIATLSANPWQLLAQSSARSILDRLSQFVLWDAALTLGAAPGWSGSAQARFSAGAGFPAVSGFSDMGNAQLLALADLTGITALSPAALAQLKGALALSSGAALSPALTAQLLAGLNLTALAALQQEYPGAVAYLLRMLLSGGAPLISATGAAPTMRATGAVPTITFSGE